MVYSGSNSSKISIAAFRMGENIRWYFPCHGILFIYLLLSFAVYRLHHASGERGQRSLGARFRPPPDHRQHVLQPRPQRGRKDHRGRVQAESRRVPRPRRAMTRLGSDARTRAKAGGARKSGISQEQRKVFKGKGSKREIGVGGLNVKGQKMSPNNLTK